MSQTAAPTQTTEPAMVVSNLTVAIEGHTILENLSFSVPTGKTTAIIGPNGAGKSVLLKALLRLIPKAHGSVTIFGTPHEQYRRIARSISYIPQKLAPARLFPLTVRGLFSLKSRRLLGLSPDEEQHMRQLLGLVGMEAYLGAKISTLSGGQLQRVLLAYSLMDHPRLLILDEPSAGIDIQGQDTVYSLLQKIQQQEKLTLLLVSHELEIVIQYAAQVLCINHALLCAGVPREVLSNDLLEKMYGTPIGHFTHHHS